jgi:hypothetical protein
MERSSEKTSAKTPSKSEASRKALRERSTPVQGSTIARYIPLRTMSAFSTSAWLIGIRFLLSKGTRSYSGTLQPSVQLSGHERIHLLDRGLLVQAIIARKGKVRTRGVELAAILSGRWRFCFTSVCLFVRVILGDQK